MSVKKIFDWVFENPLWSCAIILTFAMYLFLFFALTN